MATTIAIINNNINTGKTFISFNLAAALSILRKKTLYLTGIYNKKGNYFIEKYCEDKKKISFEENEFTGKFSSSKLKGFDFFEIDFSNIDYENKDDIRNLNMVRKNFNKSYDYIIEDPASGLTGEIEAFLFMADKYIIPLETYPESFDSLAPLISKIKWAKKDKKIFCDFMGFLVNKARLDSKLSNIFKKKGFDLFTSKFLKDIIPDFYLDDFYKKGCETILDDILSLSGKAFLNLAETIIKQENINESSKQGSY
ncbi:MAG: hypothetical protein CSA18_01165 [Deltaproteobacteria bacterium]|nr:MAG: hypothetical protein CSA18_01165 [Deltaproteobacteria bacterium]